MNFKLIFDLGGCYGTNVGKNADETAFGEAKEHPHYILPIEPSAVEQSRVRTKKGSRITAVVPTKRLKPRTAGNPVFCFFRYFSGIAIVLCWLTQCLAKRRLRREVLGL